MCYFGLSTHATIDALHQHPQTFVIAPIGMMLTETWEWLNPQYSQSTLYYAHTTALAALNLYNSYKAHQLQTRTFSQNTADTLQAVTINHLLYSLYYVYKSSIPFAAPSKQSS